MTKNKNLLKYWSDSKEETVKLARAEGYKNLKNWEIIYMTLNRWSIEDDKETLEFINQLSENLVIKKEFTKAARAVKEGTHEAVNASSQASFLIKVATGKQYSSNGKQFERTALLKNGTRIPITNIAEKQRILTSKLMTPPVKAEEIKNVKNKINIKDLKEYVMTGHTGCAYFNELGTKNSASNQVVSHIGSSTGKDGIHDQQLKAQENSSHHLSFSRRLSKILDKFQEDGSKILKAFESGKFHKNSNWKGLYIENSSEALAIALKARHNYKTRQTKEKRIRENYEDPGNFSEEYDEIRTESETETDKYEQFMKREIKKEPFKIFIEKHEINIKSKAFKYLVEKIDNAIYDKKRSR